MFFSATFTHTFFIIYWIEKFATFCDSTNISFIFLIFLFDNSQKYNNYLLMPYTIINYQIVIQQIFLTTTMFCNFCHYFLVLFIGKLRLIYNIN